VSPPVTPLNIPPVFAMQDPTELRGSDQPTDVPTELLDYLRLHFPSFPIGQAMNLAIAMKHFPLEMGSNRVVYLCIATGVTDASLTLSVATAIENKFASFVAPTNNFDLPLATKIHETGGSLPEIVLVYPEKYCRSCKLPLPPSSDPPTSRGKTLHWALGG